MINLIKDIVIELNEEMYEAHRERDRFKYLEIGTRKFIKFDGIILYDSKVNKFLADNEIKVFVKRTFNMVADQFTNLQKLKYFLM